MPKGITKKMHLFVEYYFPCNMNGTEAAIKAGYSPRTASVIATENLKKPYIKALIDAKLAEISEKNDISIEKLIKGYKNLAYSNVKNLFDEQGLMLPVQDLSDDVAAAISSIEVETKMIIENGEKIPVVVKRIKLWNKNQALDSLAKYKGMFEGKGENPINVNFMVGVINKAEEIALKAQAKIEIPENNNGHSNNSDEYV
jgi:phage terminase small subunit